MTEVRRFSCRFAALGAVLAIAACTSLAEPPPTEFPDTNYLIGPSDNLNIFVWRNPELSISVPVRPDGKISIPLVEDIPVTRRTPTQLARDLEEKLGVYVQDPIVTVIVTGFSGPFDNQIRVIGEAAGPTGLPYRDTMTLLDVLIAVGGVTEFADGNRATISRIVDGEMKQFGIRIDDLLEDGDMTANVPMLPGDVLVIPETFF
ncbi:MAG: XrtA/PEP-CTERM system exopolysaccharide export protein [Alphaproteobacteria bacterium]